MGGLRPLYGPIPGSISVVLDGPPTGVIGAAARAVRAAGLSVALADSAEGYLESGWYDVVKRRPVSDAARDLDRMIKLRFFADPTAGHTRLAAECVRRIAWDPSEPERSLERMVADSTPGRVLLDSVLVAIRAVYPIVVPKAAPAARRD